MDNQHLLLVTVVVAGRLAGYYRDIYQQAGQQISEQKKTLAQQRKLRTLLRTDDAHNRALMAAQQCAGQLAMLNLWREKLF